MSWYLHALQAQEIIREREQMIATLKREREARNQRVVASDLPRFGRIRRPLARIAGAVGSGAIRAAVALDPRLSRS